jgi:hypothetical protein
MDQIKTDCSYILDETLVDKTTGKTFEYQLKDDKNYALCAEFRTSNKNEKNTNQPAYSSPDNKSSLHDSGWQCLDRKVYYTDVTTVK